MSESLEALAGEAQQIDAEISANKPGAAPADEQPEQAAAQEITGFQQQAQMMVDLFVGMLTGYAPETKPIWSYDTRARVADALWPVLQKYNFTMGNMPPELTLLIMAAPPLWMSMKIVAEKMRADKMAARANAAKPVETVNDSDVVPDGPGRHPQEQLYPQGAA